MNKPCVEGFFEHETETWTYVVWDEEDANRRCAVIDSVLGFSIYDGSVSTGFADGIIAFIQNHNLTLEWILETHIHADHITAASYIKDKIGGKIALSKHIVTILKTWQSILNNQRDTPLDGSQFDYLFDDNETFLIGNIEARILYTPGHTPADTSYLIGDALFTGDALFLPDVGTGRCDFPGGSAQDSYDSIRKILSLPEETRLFVGHDYPPEGRQPVSMTTVKEEKAFNIRVHDGVSREAYISKRNADDKDKAVPRLLLPSIQVNLRAGRFGNEINGVRYIMIPVDLLNKKNAPK